jgi:peptide/nickel transport system permease protein
MRHLIRRIGFYLIALWVSLTLNFLIPRLAPGDPAATLMGRFQGRVGPQALAALEIQFGISHDPLWVQYFQYLNNLLHGNLGLSVTYFPSSVSAVLAQELPWTLILVTSALIFSFVVGTLLGAITAWRRGTALDNILPPVVTFISSVPYFAMALIMLYFFAFMLNLFPLSGGYDR